MKSSSTTADAGCSTTADAGLRILIVAANAAHARNIRDEADRVLFKVVAPLEGPLCGERFAAILVYVDRDASPRQRAENDRWFREILPLKLQTGQRIVYL